MVYCSLLKYLKLFYISVASFHASSTMVKDNGKVVAFQNMMRSSNGLINHKYTFISNASYAKCFRDPREHTWLYKDPKAGFKVVAFSSSINSPKPTPTPTKSIRIPTPSQMNPQSIQIKPITRSSIRPSPRLQPHHDSDSSSDDE